MDFNFYTFLGEYKRDTTSTLRRSLEFYRGHVFHLLSAAEAFSGKNAGWFSMKDFFFFISDWRISTLNWPSG